MVKHISFIKQIQKSFIAKAEPDFHCDVLHRGLGIALPWALGVEGGPDVSLCCSGSPC